MSKSISLIRRCEIEFLRDFVWKYRFWPIFLQLLNQINSDLPEVLYVSLLLPDRNLKTFPATIFRPSFGGGEMRV